MPHLVLNVIDQLPGFRIPLYIISEIIINHTFILYTYLYKLA